MDGGQTQCGVFSLESITCACRKDVLVLSFYFVCLFLWEAKGHKSIYRSDQIGTILKWAIIEMGHLLRVRRRFGEERESRSRDFLSFMCIF